MDPCRYGAACLRPLCPYVHVCSRTRACRWAELWSFLALQEEAVEEDIVDVPGPQIAAKIPQVVETKIHEEIVESVHVSLFKRIWCIFEAELYREVVKVTSPELGSERIVEKIDDLSLPQVVQENLDVINAFPQECVAKRTVKQTVDVLMPLQKGLAEVVEHIPQEPISERTDQQFMGVWQTIRQQHISERVFEQTEDVPVPQIAVPVLLQEETDEVILIFPAYFRGDL